jgi:hypothetical protein
MFNLNNTYVQEYFDLQMIDFINLTRLRLIVIHALMILINFITHSTRFHKEGVKQVAAFTGMIMQLFLVFTVTNCLYLYPNPMLFKWFKISGTFLWFEIQWIVFLGTILSNMIFIAIRTIVKHKIVLDHVPERKRLPNIDTILAIRDVANVFNVHMIPLCCSVFIFNEVDTEMHISFELQLIGASNIVSVFLALLLIFVNWKEGSHVWLKYASYL